MYSFGRLHPYNPFWGGFVHEYIDKGTYKRFYKTMARVYSYEVTEEQYEKIKKNNIKQIEANKEDYKFNIVGLVAVGFHKKIGKEKSFYCAEFVKYVIEKANIDMNLPTIIKPEDFKNVNGLQEIYSGFFRKYNYSKLDVTRILIENLSRYTKKRRDCMSRKTKIKVFKIILAILVLTLFIGITTYLFPVMKDLSSIEGQIAFKEKS